MAGNETGSEEPHPDDEEGDDLSVITIDSLKDLDSEKVCEIWTGMAESEGKEMKLLQSVGCNGRRYDAK